MPCRARGIGRKGWWGPSGFLRAAARTCWVCPAGRVRWTEGDWIPYRETPTPKAFPLGGRWAGEAGSDEGAIWYPTFPCRRRGLSPHHLPSPAPLGKSIAPSSVTFGDSFPPRGSLWVVRPYMKKRPKSGHVHGPRNSPTTVPLRPITPKRASGNERAIKKGGPGGKAPGALSSGFLRRKPGSRPESGGNPRRRSGPAMVPTEPPADHRPPPSPGEFPRPQAGKESAIMF